MKKEEIIIQAFRLCEELKTMGFDSDLDLAIHVNLLSIRVWERSNMSNYLLSVDSYLDNEVSFGNCTKTDKIIPKLTEFINEHKKQSA